MIKVIVVPFVIFIITFLSDDVSIRIPLKQSASVKIQTTLFSFSFARRRNGNIIKFFRNIQYAYKPLGFLIKNAKFSFSYYKEKGHIIFQTKIIFFLISLIIFLYSKIFALIKTRIAHVGKQIKRNNQNIS